MEIQMRCCFTGGLLIPAWSIVVLIALGQILIGLIMFLVLRRFVLTKSEETMSTYQPAPLEDISNN